MESPAQVCTVYRCTAGGYYTPILSHQSDVRLQLANSDHHRISTEGEIGGAQFLHIKVTMLGMCIYIGKVFLLGNQQKAGNSFLHLPSEFSGVPEPPGQSHRSHCQS